MFVCPGESSRERPIRRFARWTQPHLAAGGAFWRTPRKYTSLLILKKLGEIDKPATGEYAQQ